MKRLDSWLAGVFAVLLAVGAVTLGAQQGPSPAQIQAALRAFLAQPHTWTGVQTFSGGGGGSITGTGANTQVTFWTGTSTQSGSTNFEWNGTNLAFTSAHGLSFAGAKNPITFNGGNDGLGNTALIVDNPTDTYVVVEFNQFTDLYAPVNGALEFQVNGAGTSYISMADTTGIVFPNEIGTPGAGTVHLVRLGGTGAIAGNDIFLSAVDGQPGTGDNDQGRKLAIYARNATSPLPVSGVSVFLSGWFWNGAASVARSIELENKVQTSGAAQFWMEEIVGTSGFPFVKMFRETGTSPNSGAIVSATNNTDALRLGAYDTTNTAYKYFITLTAAAAPTMSITPPVNGTISINANTLQQGGNTISLSGNLTTTGAFNPTFAIPSSSTWTFPTGGGTLVASTVTTLSSLVSVGTITTGTWNASAVTSTEMATSGTQGVAVGNVGANSCGTTAATIAGNDNVGQITVGATAGTQCRVTFVTAAATRRHCTVTDSTTTIATRATYVDTTHTDFFGAFVAGDLVNYVCFAR